VGLGLWDHGNLVIEQLLVRQLGEEAPMLTYVAGRLRDSSLLVTFNGKSFDLPLLRTRFVMNRLEPPPVRPHLDLLHVARRIHATRDFSCRLVELEKHVLGFERVGDVPSNEVSACYLHFLRTADPAPLLGVVEHNTWDIVSMVALVGLYGEPLDGSQLTGEDLAGVAKTLHRAGAVKEAADTADRAVERAVSLEEPLRVRAELAKARGDRAHALQDFEALARLVDSPATRLELAKLYEHYVKSPSKALEVAALGTTETAPFAQKRVARLSKKVGLGYQQLLPGFDFKR
jgi:hypothetical protein